jgi:hypothetical protein
MGHGAQATLKNFEPKDSTKSLGVIDILAGIEDRLYHRHISCFIFHIDFIIDDSIDNSTVESNSSFERTENRERIVPVVPG